MPERAAFEHAINQTPHESLNHYAYADWLDEHGEHDEAAFRRSLGDWWKTNPPIGGHFRSSGIPEHDDENPETWAHHLPEARAFRLPRGIHNIPIFLQDAPDTSFGLLNGRNVPRQPYHPAWIYSSLHREGRLAWRTNQDMESTFREAFMHNRTVNMSRRRAQVLTYTRRSKNV